MEPEWGVPVLWGCWVNLSFTNGSNPGTNDYLSPLPTSNMKLQYKGEKPFQPVAP